MTIANFDDLLRAANAQPEPKRLLFMFATAGVDADATAEQKARFEAGQGGRLTPLMGGVRSDVVALGFFQTTIMEMGQPPAVQGADPAVWVQSRQFTGRVVTVTNSKIFEEPVYNYTREFPFIWEELRLPIAYRDDRSVAERILLNAATKFAVRADDLAAETIERLEQNYRVKAVDFQPATYWRLTDNWLELTVRFMAHDHGVRDLKDALSREVLPQLEAAGIGIASAGLEISDLPNLQARERLA